MEFSTYCLPDKRVVVVTKREEGETCDSVVKASERRATSNEVTGPDADHVREVQ